MNTVEWLPEYEIGISVIDNQHKKIIDYINEIYAIENNQQPKESLDEVLQNLVDYTYSHFSFEEALMEEAGYDDLIGHQITHEAFKNQIRVIQTRFEQGETVASELAETLQHWLLKHIRSDDISYSGVVKENFLSNNLETNQSWIKKALNRFF